MTPGLERIHGTDGHLLLVRILKKESLPMEANQANQSKLNKEGNKGHVSGTQCHDRNAADRT